MRFSIKCLSNESFLKILLIGSVAALILAIIILSSVPPVSRDALTHHLPVSSDHAQVLTDAMRYATLSGGKRIRPLLVCATCTGLGGNLENALAPACAVEFIHAYSLLHDDLPAMDDDALRRGKPTAHIEFDEATAILAGDADIVVAGGMESMTNAPYLLPKARMGYRMNQGKIEDSMNHDGLYDNLIPGHMAISAENIAEKYGITRGQCDQLAMESHQKATKAVQEGRFKKEIVPVELKSRKGSKFFDTDEHFIPDANMEAMGKLRPAFIKDGVVTAANASGINDAAAAAILMTKKKADELGLKPMLKLLNCSIEGVDPKYMGIGPAVVIPKALKLAGVKFEDVDYWELNEAFASQAIGCMRELDIDVEKPNELGSGISLGHPIGCTGARQMVSGMNLMKRKGYGTGLITMCIGGGMGAAGLFEIP